MLSLMTRPRITILATFVLLSVFEPGWSARGNWRPWDWASWTSFRFVTCAASDFRYVYFGTTGGVLRYNKFSREFEEPWTVSDGLTDGYVRNIYYDQSNDELVFQTRAGVCRYNVTFDKWFEGGEFTNSPESVYLPPEKYQNFFLDFGYSFLPKNEIQDVYLRQYQVTFGFQDDPQEIWLGTWGLGLARGNTVTGQMKFVPFGLDEKNVQALYLDGDLIYVGGAGFSAPARGVTIYDRQKKTWEYWEPSSSFNFYSADVTVIAGDNQCIWLGTKTGLVRYNKKEQRFYTFTRSWGLWENEITALKSDGKNLWIGTARGLNVYEAGQDSVIKVQMPGINRVYVYTIEVDSQTVWVGTDQGVYRLDLQEKTREKFIDPFGMVNTRVNHILKYQDQIWFATRLGILQYDKTVNKYKVYSQGVDLPGGEVLKIAVHPLAIWGATTNGAIKLDRSTNLWHLYTEFDGLLDNYVQCLVQEEDYVWFGTPEGLTRFYWNVPGRVE